MPFELLVGLILLILAAVIGLALYGFIVLVAKMFGRRSGREEDRRQCVFCRRMTPAGHDRCDWCGRELQSPLAEELADLDALKRQLPRFGRSGALKPAVVENLLGRVDRYRSRLIEGLATRAAAPLGSPLAARPGQTAAEEPVAAELVEAHPKVEPRKPAVPVTAPRQPAAPAGQPAARPPAPRAAAPQPASPRPVKPRPQPQPPGPAAPAVPRKSWAETLAGFMEERNIRWIELIGGLLIVGSAVVLVLNLWHTLSGFEYLKYFISVAATSAVFGVALYAHHRWKLESTSRGLLVIATLLVPLNFLFMALSSKANWGPTTVLAGLIALGIFAWLVGLAGGVLVPGGRWLQVVAVVGGSAAVLVTGRSVADAWWLVAAGCLPVALFAGAVGGHLYGLRQQGPLDVPRAGALFTLLGTAAFAMLLALGLLVSQAGGVNAARGYLALPVALAAVPILACGLTAGRKTARDASMAAYHTAGTTIALLGMLAMLAALGLAWPRPLAIMAIATLNCAALVFAAFYYRLPILHAGAIACGTLAYLTGFHVVYPSSDLGLLAGGEDHWREMLRLTTDASSGTALGGLFVLLGLVAEGLARRGRRRHGIVYAGGSLVVAVAGLLLVTVHGFGRPPDADALRAMILYAVYGAGSLALTARWRRAELSYLGLGLLTAACTWFLWWQAGHVEPVWATVLAAGALLMGAIAAVMSRRLEHPPGTTWSDHVNALRSGSLVELYRIPLLHVAEIVALLGLTIGVLTGFSGRETPMPAITAGCLAALWMLLAWTYRSHARTWVGSMLVLAGLVHTLWFNYHELIGPSQLSLLVALLAHSTLAVAAGLALDAWTRSRSDRRPGETIGRVFSKPLCDTALLSSVLGLLLVTWHGFAATEELDALRAAVLYGVYGAGSLALTARWRRAELSYLGLSLLSAAPMWALWSHSQTHDVALQVWAAVLAGEALLLGAIAEVLRHRLEHLPTTAWREQLKALRSGPLIELYRLPLLHLAETVAPVALILGVLTGFSGRAAPMPVMTPLFLAALYFLLAWTYRSQARTWVGSMLVLAGLIHTLGFNYDQWIAQPRLSLLIALLAHCTLAVAAGLALDTWTRSRSDHRLGEPIGRVFSRPLGDTALLSSALAVPMLALELLERDLDTAGVLALCLFWLAAVWLVVSWRNRYPGLFAAHQVVLALAVLTATTALLKQWGWVTNMPSDLLDAQNLQAHAIGLGLLSLVWIIARIALRDDKVARKLLSPHGPAVDRIIRHAVVWLQLLLIGWHLLPGISYELLPRFPTPSQTLLTAGGAQFPTPSQTQLAAGGGAWVLLMVIAAVLSVTLWYRWRISMTSSLLLAATIPCLVAGQFAGPTQQAVASALRWGSAVCFVVCSVAVWQRNRLLQAVARARANVDVGPAGPGAARVTLLATTAAPVLLLTVFAALVQLGGAAPGGPADGSFFDSLGPNVSYLVPLLLVMLGLVGFALRERSAAYAFSAGLVAELTVTLGYALHVATDPDPARKFGTAELVTLIQLATITAALWAGAWLAVRRWLDVWRERPLADVPSAAKPVAGTEQAFSGRRHVGQTPRILMNVQLGMGAAGNALLLGAALLTLILFGPPWQDWTKAAGGPLGWIALLSVAAAYVYRQLQAGRRVHPQMIGLLGMTVLGLLACTVEWQLPGSHWGYRTLMLGWATFAWFIVLATWWAAGVRTLPDAQGPPQALIRAAAVWVRVAGLAAVLLGLKAAFWHHEEQLWAAAAIATASAAGATMAVWRRREGWAFSAALGANLAASLVVWHFQRTLDFGQWWLRLVEANVIASAAVALIWLAARRRLYQLRELTLGQSPLLAAQTATAIVGNVVILVVPALWLTLSPGHLPGWITRPMAQVSDLPGWLGLLLAAAAAAWYLRQVLPGNLLHVLGGLGLGAGVLAACSTTDLGDRGGSAWLPYHTLTTAWAAVGLSLLGLALLGRRLRLAAEDDGQSILPTFETAVGGTGRVIFPSALVQNWVTAIGSLVLLLAVIHAHTDPESPWWSARAILAVSLMAGILGVWLRRPAYVLISGLLPCVIGVIAWMAWMEPAWELPALAALVQANVLCLGLGSVVWSVLRLIYPGGVPDVRLGDRPLPFPHLAARGAVGLLAVVVAAAAVSHALAWQQTLVIQRLDWIALAAATVAVTICLWDRSSRLALPGLYDLGLLTLGMGLCARGLLKHEFCQAAAIELAAWVLAAAVLGVLLPRLAGVWRLLRIHHDDRRWPHDWLPAAQAVAAATVVVLSVWISLDFDFHDMTHGALGWRLGRSAGPLATALLLPAAILAAGRAADRWRDLWQQATLGLGLLILSELGFVWLVPQREPSWLWMHRSVVLMVAAVVMTLVASLGLRRLLPETSDWVTAGRRITPVLGGLALLMLAVVLIQEGMLSWRMQEGMLSWRMGAVAMTPPAIVVVTVSLSALVAACLGFAAVPRWDPLGLTERGRTAYVYAAEALVALTGLHLWLTVPWLFDLGFVEKYWMLIVMAVAFVGAGLSELFHRRRMPVLSEPLRRTALLLPLAPAIGYWLMKGTTGQTWFLGDASPALWFLMGLFYGFMAVNRRSIWLGTLAVLAGNTGLWVLWPRLEIPIYEHPQLWLIPIALSALVAEYLHHDRLDRAQGTAVRYLALSVIYLSSTADMFIAEIGKDLVTPLVLMFLASLGALAGIFLRVRSFLYLGVAFLVLDIVTMVWHAAVQRQMWWIAAACGIVLGAAILALAMFWEKRRNDLLAAVERFKHWER